MSPPRTEQTAPGAARHSHPDLLPAAASDDDGPTVPLPLAREQIAALSHDELAALAEELRREELRRLGDAPSRRAIDWLMQSEKLASVGILTRGIAHEFNNLFTGVIGYCDFALSGDDRALQRKALEVALAASRKASVIVKNLQTFAKRKKTRVTDLDAIELLERSITLMENSLRLNKIKLVKRLPPDLPPVRADASELEQVFLNVLTNAMQAIDGAGEIRVAAERDGDWAVVRIADTGCGIPPQLRTRIFEPFFSTKGVYGDDSKKNVPGTGLGLSVVHGIVERLGGLLDFESEVGKGTTFTIRLPLGATARGKPRSSATHAARTTSRTRPGSKAKRKAATSRRTTRRKSSDPDRSEP